MVRSYADPLSFVVVTSKMTSGFVVALFALDLTLDTGAATVAAAALVALSSMWQSWMLTKVHTLVNSNFSEAKAARIAAEESLKTQIKLNTQLQVQLSTANVIAGAAAATSAAGAHAAPVIYDAAGGAVPLSKSAEKLDASAEKLDASAEKLEESADALSNATDQSKKGVKK